MANEYLRAVTAVSVHTKDGNALSIDRGQVIPANILADHVSEALKDSDSHASMLFEKASQKDYEGQPEPQVDVATQSMILSEELSRKRAQFPEADRFGSVATGGIPPAMMDAGRTLPESGADYPANDNWAEHGTELAEKVGQDRVEQGQEFGEAAGEGGLPESGVPTETIHLREGGEARKRGRSKPSDGGESKARPGTSKMDEGEKLSPEKGTPQPSA